MVVMQVFLWMLMEFKKRTARRGGWSNTPIMKQVIRDDVFSLAVIIGFFLAIQPSAFKMNIIPSLLYLWPNTLLTIFTCRLVLNFSKLKPENSKEAPPMELTTILDSMEVSMVESTDLSPVTTLGAITLATTGTN